MSSTSDSELIANLDRALASREARLITPALVIDLDQVEHNVKTVIDRVGHASRWRPHVKTLKQSRLIRLLMQRGMSTFKCATIDELALVCETAERVDPDGRVDVLLAMPATPSALEAALALLDEHEGATLRLLADAPDHLESLLAHRRMKENVRRVNILLDVDVGFGRTGSSTATWARWFEAHSQHRERIGGLHAYEGHLHAHDESAANEAYAAVARLAEVLSLTKKSLVVTSGTPTFMHALESPSLRSLAAQHQVSPGTVVLGDLMTDAELPEVGIAPAAFVISRVIALPGDDRFTTDSGTKSVSPDRQPNVGRPLGHPDAEIVLASEEHLVLRTSVDRRPARNEKVWFVPSHVCTTVNSFRQVLFVRGTRFVAVEDVEAMSRTSGARR